jgi:hypothetical protein
MCTLCTQELLAALEGQDEDEAQTQCFEYDDVKEEGQDEDEEEAETQHEGVKEEERQDDEHEEEGQGSDVKIKEEQGQGSDVKMKKEFEDGKAALEDIAWSLKEEGEDAEAK